MGFWGDGIYRFDEIEVRDQSDRAWAIAFIMPTAISSSTYVNIFFLVRNNDILSNIDDEAKYPNGIIDESYFRIYKNIDRIPIIELLLSDEEIVQLGDGVYQYIWSVPAFDVEDAFSVELELKTEYVNPASISYPEETITVDRTFTFSVGGKGGDVIMVSEGTYPVDHDFEFPDNLRAIDEEGAGIGGIYIYAYLKSDYDAGNRGDAFKKGISYTKEDGRWANPMALEPGTNYRICWQGGTFVEEIGITEIKTPE